LFLITAGIGALGMALALSYMVGTATFLVLTGLSILGIAYSVPIVPKQIRKKSRYTKIKDVPGSRSLSEALAWTAVIGLLPLLGADATYGSGAFITGMVIFTWSYARAIFFSLLQVQGDLMVGTESLPITLGERRTLILLKTIFVITGVVLLLGPAFDIAGTLCYLMLIPLCTLWLSLLAYEKQWLYPGIALEAIVEVNFLLAGLLALFWQIGQ